jgi:hypothetical protein
MVQADTQALGDLLRALVKTVLAAGGQLHPGIRFVERDGQLGVHCQPGFGQADQPLFRLPLELLVPIDGIEWADREDELQARSSLAHLPPLQRDLLDLHLALYNATGKLPWAVQHLPGLAVPRLPSLQTALQAIRPGFGPSRPQAAQAFFQTRVLKLADKKVLMPLIDLLNHHPQGAAFHTNACAMTVAVAQPHDGDECFARYGGRRDVLDLALHYGYADNNTPFAFSAPFDGTLPGVGRVQITAQRLRAIHPMDPPVVTFDEAGMTLSHLACHRQHPQRLRAVLRLALLGAAHRQGCSGAEADRVVTQVFDALCATNLALLQEVQKAAQPLKAWAPVAALLDQAALLQAKVIRVVLMLPGA